MNARMLYLHALSRVHSGTGQSTDVIDLPIAREKVYGWPYLPGSSIKGVLRDACDPGATPSDPAVTRRFESAFGPPTDRADEGAGQLWFLDAHLLCLPVRSFAGVFAWVTCPLALKRWRRDHGRAGLGELPVLTEIPDDEGILLPSPPGRDGSALTRDGKVYLEDYDLQASDSLSAASIAERIAGDVFADDEWRAIFKSRFGVIHDDLFSMLAETATDVDARIRLNEGSKTVARGALWYEESAPAESIFACPVLAAPRNGMSDDELFGVIAPALARLLQIGGNAGVGRGLVEARLAEARA